MTDKTLLFEFDQGTVALEALRPLMKNTQNGMVKFQKYEDMHGLAFGYIAEEKGVDGEILIAVSWHEGSDRRMIFKPTDIKRMELSTSRYLTIFLD